MEGWFAVKRFRERVLPALACALILGAPGSTIASVVPNACIAGVGLWDSREQVAREWGPPSGKAGNWLQPTWHYPNGTVDFARVAPNRWIVTQIVTTDPRERLDGIGVGSWRSEVHAATRGCPRGWRFCRIASARRERRGTNVHFDGDRVTELSIFQNEWNEGRLSQPDKRCRNTT
jgi:hypothetical protein